MRQTRPPQWRIHLRTNGKRRITRQHSFNSIFPSENTSSRTMPLYVRITRYTFAHVYARTYGGERTESPDIRRKTNEDLMCQHIWKVWLAYLERVSLFWFVYVMTCACPRRTVLSCSILRVNDLLQIVLATSTTYMPITRMTTYPRLTNTDSYVFYFPYQNTVRPTYRIDCERL